MERTPRRNSHFSISPFPSTSQRLINCIAESACSRSAARRAKLMYSTIDISPDPSASNSSKSLLISSSGMCCPGPPQSSSMAFPNSCLSISPLPFASQAVKKSVDLAMLDKSAARTLASVSRWEGASMAEVLPTKCVAPKTGRRGACAADATCRRSAAQKDLERKD